MSTELEMSLYVLILAIPLGLQLVQREPDAPGVLLVGDQVVPDQKVVEGERPVRGYAVGQEKETAHPGDETPRR